MAFSRNSMAAAIAGSLSLAVLTGCNPPAAVQPSTAPSAAPSAAASATAAPSAAPSAATSPTGSATPAPAVSAPAASGKTVTVSGKVYDEAGALVDGATITVKSLNDAQAYSATATTVNGNYVFNAIPEGVQVALTVTKDKWTSRTKTEAFQASATIKNEVNFGGPVTGGTDPYFISKFPEIVSTTPEHDATGVDSSKVSYKLTLSEALDETNRRRFRSALRLSRLGADISGGTDAFATGSAGSTANSELVDGASFLGETDVKATVTWNAAGNEATLNFNAPLLASSTSELEYKVYLAYNTNDVIEDSDGNNLGKAGETGYDSAFKNKTLATVTTGDNWVKTHQAENKFKVAEDDTDPKLTGVSVAALGSNKTRIELTFSEPMVAYNKTSTGVYRQSLNNLENYTFMVGEKLNDLKSSDLEGKDKVASGFAYDIVSNSTPLSRTDAKREFRFKSGVEVSLDPRNANRVRLDLNRANFFGTELSEIKARVSGVSDPAGNSIGSADADDNLVTGTI